MKRLALTLAILPLLTAVLSACSSKTALRFTNETECGPATITLTNIETGNVEEFTIEEGETHEVTLDPLVEYRYEVTYPRMPGSLQCDSKRVTTALEQGKTVNVKLTSVLDDELLSATATAEAGP